MIKFGNDIIKVNGDWLDVSDSPEPPFDPYNPLNLPPYTIRYKLKAGVVPTGVAGTYTQVSSNPNIWDWTYEDPVWAPRVTYQFYEDVLEVLGVNSTGVTDMNHLFSYCSDLTSIPLFDTRSVTNMEGLCFNCTSLTLIPLFDVTNVTNMNDSFYNCVNVTTGSLALYQQASTKAIPVTKHTSTFYKCGSNTPTGAAELAQIPRDWGNF